MSRYTFLGGGAGVNSELSAEGFPESLGVQSSMYALAGKKKGG